MVDLSHLTDAEMLERIGALSPRSAALVLLPALCRAGGLGATDMRVAGAVLALRAWMEGGDLPPPEHGANVTAAFEDLNASARDRRAAQVTAWMLRMASGEKPPAWVLNFICKVAPDGHEESRIATDVRAILAALIDEGMA